MISEYLKIPIFQVAKLNVIEHKFFLREAFIYNHSKTEEGIEYLKNAKRLEETDIDRVGLREAFGKK